MCLFTDCSRLWPIIVRGRDRRFGALLGSRVDPGMVSRCMAFPTAIADCGRDSGILLAKARSCTGGLRRAGIVPAGCEVNLTPTFVSR